MGFKYPHLLLETVSVHGSDQIRNILIILESAPRSKPVKRDGSVPGQEKWSEKEKSSRFRGRGSLLLFAQIEKLRLWGIQI